MIALDISTGSDFFLSLGNRDQVLLEYFEPTMMHLARTYRVGSRKRDP